MCPAAQQKTQHKQSEKKKEILLNFQNHKYNLKCCNRATGDDIRSLILSMYSERVLNTHVCQCAYSMFVNFFLPYITSIIEAGNDSSEVQEPTMKSEGKRDVSRRVDRIRDTE